MNHAIERAIIFYRLTQGPLRCLAACDPCGRTPLLSETMRSDPKSLTRNTRTEARRKS